MNQADRKPRVLFLCTGNACRSQMAEGWARALHPGVMEAWSAGTRPSMLDPRAARAMGEVGIDISMQTSKAWEAVPSPIDLVVAVCGSAAQSCPSIPALRTIHAPFDDPPRLARGSLDEAAAMMPYRRVRDEIRRFVESLPERLHNPSHERTAP